MHSDADILAARSVRRELDPWKPSAFHIEAERSANGMIEDVATIFLVNRECPFRCTMCDLWKYTLEERVPRGAIPAQIDYALQRLPRAKHVKLYNAGNFFDAQAIPQEDHAAIADRVRGFETVIVENHPCLTNHQCVEFRDRLGTRLEVALGLETIHPQVLNHLNKRMTVADFDRAAGYLRDHDIDVRAFVLLKPPGQTEQDGIEWALKSVEHAFQAGARCCSLIPTRSGNGFMEILQGRGEFSPPTLQSLESVLEQALALTPDREQIPGRGQRRVFVDLWNVESLFECSHCGPARAARLQQMNLLQAQLPQVTCACCGHGASRETISTGDAATSLED